MHEMEGSIEARGRAAFPGLDVVSRGLVSGTEGQCCRPARGLAKWNVHGLAGSPCPRAFRLSRRTDWHEVGRIVYPWTRN